MNIAKYTNAPSCLDAYKTGHHVQYPDNTEIIVSNFTPRGSRILGVNHAVFFGLQVYLKRILGGLWEEFFCNPDRQIEKYKTTVQTLLNKSHHDVSHLRDLAKLGYMPLIIRAVPEGTRVPMRVPMLTIENTDLRFAWLPNFLETQLSDELWGPCTSATIADEYRRVFNKYAKMTGAPEPFCEWQGHDFSMRGMWGIDAAAFSGAAHLLSSYGTDTVPAIHFAQRYYDAGPFVGGSVPATEHSVMCCGGSTEGEELKTFERLLNLYSEGILSVVSDTWDYWNVLNTIIPALKEKIMSRNGKLVIRPDSGDPVKILVGDPTSDVPHIRKGTVEMLWDIFGGTVSATGHKMLDSHIGVIYGDSITLDRQYEILEGLRMKGFASCNVVLGIGSFTYQHVTRDTFGFAIKATAGRFGGEWKPLYKAPKTDSGVKNSAKGLVLVKKDSNGELVAEENVSYERFNSDENLLVPVYENGKILKTDTFERIRSRLNATR